MSITDSVHIQRSPLVVTRDMWPEWSVSPLGSTFKKQTGISHSLYRGCFGPGGLLSQHEMHLSPQITQDQKCHTAQSRNQRQGVMGYSCWYFPSLMPQNEEPDILGREGP